MSHIVADLIGGPASGRTIAVPEDAEFATLAVPYLDEPLPIDPAGPVTTTFVTLKYRRTGIRDDGRRIFAYNASASR